jgi:hypothetical protein
MMDIKKRKRRKTTRIHPLRIVQECGVVLKLLADTHTFVFPFEIDRGGRSARVPPPLMLMVRLLMPMKDVLVDQEPGVLMKLREQLLPLMMILTMRPAATTVVVILANQRIDDGNPDVGGSRVVHNSSLDILLVPGRKRCSGQDIQVMARGLYLNFAAGEHGDPAAGSEDSQ